MNFDINVGDFLTTRAYLNPGKEAFYDISADRRFTFDEINRRCNQAAAALQSLGLDKGDRVAILAYNGYQFLESFFGAAKVGLVLMPLNWRLTAKELSFILEDGGAKAIIFDADFAAVVEQIRAEGEASSKLEYWIEIGQNTSDFALKYENMVAEQSDSEPVEKAGPDDNLFIMYTSGTTGLPKGVVHTHNTQFSAVLTIANTSDWYFSDKHLILLPLFHVGAVCPLIAGIYRGNTIAISRNFNPEKTWALIEQEQISVSLAVPAMLNLMLQVPEFEKHDWSSLRILMCGAAPVPVSTIHTFNDLGIDIYQLYGLTETCGPACIIGPEDVARKIGSTGKAYFHTMVRIVDKDGIELPVGEPGEVVVSGGHIMKEYWNRPEATAEVIKEGWLLTGDIAIQDEEGFITIQDRIKDMIISGGENIYPAEIENVLLKHPDVVDAAVIGQASERWGETPFAVVVKSAEALTSAKLLSHCKRQLSRFKLPREIVFVGDIPRTSSGKILKRVLRDKYPGPDAGRGPNRPTDPNINLISGGAN
jgi:acyl-CoA synthetase (AMP-forming)/AMP-acid ligase II